jgi:DNA-binding response OmpR family regulator
VARAAAGRELKSMRCFLVEDHDELAQLLVSQLASAGFETDRAATAAEAQAILEVARYAAIILDLGLPDGDGYDVLRGIRGRKDPTPVLVLTARASVDDRVKGLRAGADDYLVKPFAFEELAARLEALLRRPGEWPGSVLQAANLSFDVPNRQVYIDDQPQVFSPREIAVLELLIRRKGRVILKQAIEDQLFGMSEVGSNAIEVYIHRLRKQLADRGANVEIHTVRGVGYLLTSCAGEQG